MHLTQLKLCMIILNAALPGEVEPVLTSILPGNLAHKDNTLLLSYSNTKTGRAAVPVVEPVQAVAVPPSREVADLLP